MTDAGIAREIVRDRENGRVVPVGDAGAFGTAITELWRDPALRARLRDKARETVAGMYPKTREEYLVHYRECLESCVAKLDKKE